jgi:hypothetical protein
VPNLPGVYAWYFRETPSTVPTAGCIQSDGKTLLYIGISPSAPPTNGNPQSSQSLKHRVRYHYCGNAEGSTLRLTLGCLLATQLGIELRLVGSGRRMTFGHSGEIKLSEWMASNAFVSFHVCEKPWELEAELVANACLPLNLTQNQNHAFRSVLSGLRRSANSGRETCQFSTAAIRNLRPPTSCSN